MSSKKLKRGGGPLKRKKATAAAADNSDGEEQQQQPSLLSDVDTDDQRTEKKRKRNEEDEENGNDEQGTEKKRKRMEEDKEEPSPKKNRRLDSDDDDDGNKKKSSKESELKEEKEKEEKEEKKEGKKEKKQHASDDEDEDVFTNLANAPPAQPKDQKIPPPSIPSLPERNGSASPSKAHANNVIRFNSNNDENLINFNKVFQKDPNYFRNLKSRPRKYTCIDVINDKSKKPEIQFKMLDSERTKSPKFIEVVGAVARVYSATTHPFGTNIFTLDGRKNQLDRKFQGKPIGPSASKPFSHVYKLTLSTEPTCPETTGTSTRNKKYDTEVIAYAKFLLDESIQCTRDVGEKAMKGVKTPVLLDKPWDSYMLYRQKKGKDAKLAEMLDEWVSFGFENVNPGIYLALPDKEKQPDKWREICTKPDPDDPSLPPKKKNKLELYTDAVVEFPEIVRIPIECPVWTEVKKDEKGNLFPPKTDYVQRHPILNDIYDGTHEMAKKWAPHLYNDFQLCTIGRDKKKHRVSEDKQQLFENDYVCIQSKASFGYGQDVLRFHVGHYTNDFVVILMKQGGGPRRSELRELEMTDDEEILLALEKAGEMNQSRDPESQGHRFTIEDVAAGSSQLIVHPSAAK